MMITKTLNIFNSETVVRIQNNLVEKYHYMTFYKNNELNPLEHSHQGTIFYKSHTNMHVISFSIIILNISKSLQHIGLLTL